MRPARSLHEVLSGLAGNAEPGAAAGMLADGGHADLPAELLVEAIASYADTAPAEVAEHLAPFVQAHRGLAGGPAPDPAAGLDLLATAPRPADPDQPVPPELDLPAAEFGTGADPGGAAAGVGADPFDLDFGDPGDLDSLGDLDNFGAGEPSAPGWQAWYPAEPAQAEPVDESPDPLDQAGNGAGDGAG